MSIVNFQTFRPRLGPSSVVNQKVHGMMTYIHKLGRGTSGKSVHGNAGGCVGVFTIKCGV